MRDEKALRPGFSIPDFIKQEKVIETEDLTDEEKILSQGRQTAFWRTLREHFDNQVNELEKIQDNAIANGASREEIGENAVVISLTRGVLRNIVNKVEDAREVKDGK